MSKNDPQSSQRPDEQKLADRGGVPLTRRGWMAGAAGAAAAAAVTSVAHSGSSAEGENEVAKNADSAWKVTRGRINQSVCLWCFQPMEVEELARAAAGMGLRSVELVDPRHWPILKKYDLVCAITSSHGFVRGLNHTEHHAECVEKLTASIEASSVAGFPNVITFSGMRGELDDEQGITNTVAGIKKVIALAERKKVNLCLEPLNTRVDVEMKGHPGYQCDRVEWAVEVCDRVGSDRMKILFDIYHVQIMQGDLIVRIRQYKDYIAHYHTAGVPGRNELDDTQEINYPAVMQAIVDTGYKGYVGQEFIPRADDKIASLRQAARLCDV